MGAIEDLKAMLEQERRGGMAHRTSSGSGDRKAIAWEEVGAAIEGLNQRAGDMAGNRIDAGSILDNVRRGVAGWNKANKSAWDASRSVMPEVRAQGNKEIAEQGMQLADMVGGMGAIGKVAKVAKVKKAPMTQEQAIAAAEEKTRLLRQDAPISVPDGPEFWPWRVQHGGYGASFNKKENKWIVEKTPSADEEKLRKAIAKAEKDIKDPANYTDVWDLKGLKRPEQQNQRLVYETRAKGVPEWISAQYGPEYEALLKGALDDVVDPNAYKFYWTGQMQDDFRSIYGRDAGQDKMQRLMSSLGATTAGARPPQNFKMATYYDVRANQGLPLPIGAPYPYGHSKAGTHLDSLQSLSDNGGVFLDPKKNPKGATFAGNNSGQTSDMTMDEVMTTTQGLKNQAGKAEAAPIDGTYDVPVDVGRKITADVAANPPKTMPPEVVDGLTPMDIQSGDWAVFGGDPTYAKPLLQHASDRINVTARVTGLPVDVVKRLFLEKKIPVLSTLPLGFGLGAAYGPDESTY